jgi:carbon-monoxide dehydrogenase medium subunit
MKAPQFKYHTPENLAEAVALLGAHENAILLAGGQSLMPMLNLRVAAPDHLIDLGRISTLRGIADCGATLSIGAMTTQRAVEHSALVVRTCPLLAEAIVLVGHQQTRNRGTIGGSLCHLDPGAELPVVACALDAELTIVGANGERRVLFRDFAKGYLSSQLTGSEVLTRIDWPKAPARTGAAFLEFNRRPADFAIVSAAVQVSLRADGAIENVWAALGGVQPTPLRLKHIASALMGVTPANIAQTMGQDIAAGIDCDGDALYPPDYRRHLCGTLFQRALTAACARAEQAYNV